MKAIDILFESKIIPMDSLSLSKKEKDTFIYRF
jgi:hypothetical protein